MPTALELTASEREHYIDVLRRQAAAMSTPLSMEEEKLRNDLLVKTRQLAAQIKQQYGARRIILFGSLAHGAWFHSDSDVDLAVEGLDGASYWQAWRLAEEVLVGRSVDLIDIHTASPSLKAAIEQYGVAL